MTFRSLAALLVAVVLAGCFTRTAWAGDPPPVILGAVFNLEGAQVDLDIPSLNGARLAVDQANSAGGVAGRDVELVVADGLSDLKTVTAKTAALIDENPSVAALMGLSDTDMVLAAAPIAANHQRVFLTSGATSPRLPAQVPAYLFLACFGDNVQAAAAAEWTYRDLSARTVSVLYNSSKAYTRLLHGYFQTRFAGLGGRIVSVEPYTRDDFGQAIERLKQSDMVFLSAESPHEALAGVRQLRQAGFSVPIVGGDGFDDAEVWLDAPDIADVFFTTHVFLGADSTDSKVRAFRKAYGEAYPGEEPTGFAALGYDAARLLMTAVGNANSTEPEQVLKALANISNFEGVTGSLRFANASRIPIKTVSILRIVEGKTRLVEQVLPEQVPPP
jgi:branched-chain amino acid transport system substrate-binding protein